MKILKYQLMRKVNYGTEETPDIVQTLHDCEIRCSDANFEANYAIAQAEAYNGDVTVEEVEDPVVPPSTEERVTALEDALAQTDEAAIELYEAQAEQEEINAAQDEALIELYEMIGG